MGDVTDKRLLYVKGGLFLIGGVLSSALLLAECPRVEVAVLLGLAVWCFARAYYFAFYVVEHYIAPGYRFAGLIDFARYALGRRTVKPEAATTDTATAGRNSPPTT